MAYMEAVKSHLDPESLVARIIVELRAKPDAQKLLLRALLTNEFLGMPARLERVEADVAELKIDVKQLKTDVKQLKTDVNQLQIDVGQLKGDSLEVKLSRRIRPLLSQRFGLRRSQVIQGMLQDPPLSFGDAVESAVNEGRIDDRQEIRLEATDLILRARRKTDGRAVWATVEASNHIGRRDIERARRSAEALRVVFEQEALAVVVGYRVAEQDRQRAESQNVHVIVVGESD